MYKGVPTLEKAPCSSIEELSITLANPKSVILAYPSCNMILAGLISRWIMLLLYNYLNPWTIWRMICTLSPSVILFCLRINMSFRSPSLQYSRNMYRLRPVLAASYILTMFLSFIFYIISISLFNKSRNLGSVPTYSKGITFTATILLVEFKLYHLPNVFFWKSSVNTSVTTFPDQLTWYNVSINLLIRFIHLSVYFYKKYKSFIKII